MRLLTLRLRRSAAAVLIALAESTVHEAWPRVEETRSHVDR